MIDAIFGNDLHTPLNRKWKTIFQQITHSSPLSISAVDLPSGFMTNRVMDEDYPYLKADHVFTFEIPKTGLLFRTAQK